jgi:hypothetical protein
MRCSGGSNSGVETIVGETANTEHCLVTFELGDDSLGVVGASTRRTGRREDGLVVRRLHFLDAVVLFEMWLE